MKFRIWFLTLLVSEPSLLAQASVYVKKEQPDDHWSGLRLFMVILMAIGIIIYEVTNKKNRVLRNSRSKDLRPGAVAGKAAGDRNYDNDADDGDDDFDFDFDFDD